jgi:hypothetical protein
MTALETIELCRQRGIVLVESSNAICCKAPPGGMTTDLHAALAQHSREIRRMIGADEPSREVSTNVVAAGDFVKLLTADDLPQAPFTLHPWSVVTDRTKFLETLKKQMLDAKSAASKTLCQDVTRLRDLLVPKST